MLTHVGGSISQLVNGYTGSGFRGICRYHFFVREEDQATYGCFVHKHFLSFSKKTAILKKGYSWKSLYNYQPSIQHSELQAYKHAQVVDAVCSSFKSRSRRECWKISSRITVKVRPEKWQNSSKLHKTVIFGDGSDYR